MTMGHADKEDDEPCWPIAAASRIRVKVNDGTACYSRLFYNRLTGSIELIHNSDDDCDATTQQRAVYDDIDANIEEEPSYQSYLATARDDSRTVEEAFHPDDVIGAHLSLEYNIKNPNTFHGMQSYASAKLIIYSYPKSGKHNKRMASHKHYTLDSQCCEDFADARIIIKSIHKLSKLCHVSSPLKCLVILNPFSGGGGESSKNGAKHVYQKMVKPMLEEAGVEYDALVTQRGGHARERMAARKESMRESPEKNDNGYSNNEDGGINTDSEMKDISEYDAIIAMGGDGILFEIFQGIHARSDDDAIMTQIKFGIVACGTYNGLAKSILHWSGADYDRVESMFHICKGHTSTLDVATYQVLSKTKPNKSYASFLSFAWGLIADCDYESECLRWLGPIRSDIWAVYRGILFRRRYHARFSYLPPNNVADNSAGKKRVVMPKLGQPLPDGWVSFEEELLVFWVCNTSHAAYNMFTCPMAKMNDGLFHVLIVRSSCSRLRLLQLLLKLDSGGHVDCKDCEVIDCVAYQFEPLSNVSYNVLDGELLEDGPTQARFIPSGAQFFAGEMVE
ncbi:hypothetical protein ACHAXR_008712 [Thalassiosira sp. AJA248-18]